MGPLFNFPHFVFLALLVNFSLLLLSLFFCRDKIKSFFSGVSGKTWLFLLAVFLLAFCLRFVFPTFHLYYTDGLWNIEVANNMLTRGSAETCRYLPDAGMTCVQYGKPAAIQLVYAFSFLFLGSGANSVFYSNLFFGSLLVFAVFSVSYALSKSGKAALFSAFLVSLMPLFVSHSNYLDNDIPSVFFILLALFCLFLFFKEKNRETQFLAVVALVFALQTKWFSVILLALLPLAAYFYWKPRRVYFFPALFLVLFLVPIAVQNLNYIDLVQSWSLENLGTGIVSADFFSYNSGLCAEVFYENVPFYAYLMGLFGVLYFLSRGGRKKAVFLFFWILCSVAIPFLYEITPRMLLMFLVSFSVLAGGGFCFLHDFLKRKSAFYGSLFALLSVLIVASSFYFPLLQEFSSTNYLSEERMGIVQTPILGRLGEDFPKDCLLLATGPEAFSFAGIESAYFPSGGCRTIGVLLDERECVIVYREPYEDAISCESHGIFSEEELVYFFRGKTFVFLRMRKAA